MESAPTNYDLLLEDTPLTQEEEAVLSQMDEPHNPPALVQNATPKRRKRSASPYITPSRLRSSVKPTARALDAGYKPNTSHQFRQKAPAEPPDISMDGMALCWLLDHLPTSNTQAI